MMRSPRSLLFLGVFMMFGGIILPFLMMIKLLTSTFFLNFFSWGISTIGLCLATIGFSMFTTRFKE